MPDQVVRPRKVPTTDVHQSYRWRKLQAEFRSYCAASRLPCHVCHQPINYSIPARSPQSFEADHLRPVSTTPELAYQWANLRPSHKSCNGSRQAESSPAQSAQWAPADW